MNRMIRTTFAWLLLLLFFGSDSHYFHGCTIVVNAFGGISTTKHTAAVTTSTSCLHAIKLPFLTSPTSSSSQKPTMIPTKSKLTPIQRLKIQQFNNDEEEEANDSFEGNHRNQSKFDQFKSILYSVSDTTQQTATQMLNARSATTTAAAAAPTSGGTGKNSKVYDGFNSKSSVVKPGLSPFTTALTAFRSPFQKAESTVVVVDIPTKLPSFFDTLKGTVYNTADFITTSALPSKSSTTKEITSKISPIQRVSSKSIVKRTSTSSSTVDPFTQLKEGFYTMNDIITKTIETVPMIPKKVEQTSQRAMTFVTRTIPNRAQENVNTITSIPNRIEQMVNDVQSTIENKVEQTKQLFQSIQAIPDQVQGTVSTTQKSMNSIQESVEDITSSIQVQLGLRKPTVQPPKRVPPPTKSTASDIMIDVAWAGTRTIGTLMGKSLLWLGQTSFEWARTTIEDAIKKQKATDDISANDENKESVVTTVANFNIDENDILATLKMAEEAIALAADATTTVNVAASTDVSTDTSTISTSTNIPNNKVDRKNGGNGDDDDDFDIMATLQMANDAIALAESVTTTSTGADDSRDDKSIVKLQ